MFSDLCLIRVEDCRGWLPLLVTTTIKDHWLCLEKGFCTDIQCSITNGATHDWGCAVVLCSAFICTTQGNKTSVGMSNFTCTQSTTHTHARTRTHAHIHTHTHTQTLVQQKYLHNYERISDYGWHTGMWPFSLNLSSRKTNLVNTIID